MPLAPDRFLLTDRVALVTGAAAGLGASIAGAFARFGARLAVCDRDGDALGETCAALPPAAVCLSRVLDVRDGDAVRQFVDEAAAATGGLQVVVNNAGGGFHARFESLSDNAQRALVDENFTSATQVIRAALPHLEDGGSIVNVTSIEAHRAAPGYAIYAAMKAALANLTMSLALELADRRIRVNCIAPDMIPTPGIGPLPDGPAATPLPVAGEPDDVAAAAVYLACDASRFVTGTTLHVDGGNRAAAGWRRDDRGDFGVA